MQTPLQQAIEKLIQFGAGLDMDKQLIVTGCIIRLHNLIPTEREVIEEAWNTGKEDGKDMGYHGRAEHTSAQHYFTTKFNN